MLNALLDHWPYNRGNDEENREGALRANVV